MAALIPEIFKSIQVRLRQIRDQYVAKSSPNEVFELEELARESYDAISRVNKNLLRMIEIERSLNAANELTGSSEMRMCRQLLREIAQLSGVESVAWEKTGKLATSAGANAQRSLSVNDKASDTAIKRRGAPLPSTDSGMEQREDPDGEDRRKP
jgi:asparagine synthetase B (glutamine-hydrolysing)